MFAYVRLGTDDPARAVAFYDPLMALLGRPRVWTGPAGASWGSAAGGDPPGFDIGLPYDGRRASAGNGVMIAFTAKDPETVRALHAAALAGGGRDEGGPGLRPDYGPDFYVAYVRDPDGNKLAFACYLSAETKDTSN